MKRKYEKTIINNEKSEETMKRKRSSNAKKSHGNRIQRFVPMSRIDDRLGKVKSLFKGESKLMSKINSNIEKVNKLKNSSHVLAKFQIAILENQNLMFSSQLGRVQNKKHEIESKLNDSLANNNQILAARKIN